MVQYKYNHYTVVTINYIHNIGRPSPKNKYIGFLLYETRTFNRHWLLQFFVYKDIKVYEKVWIILKLIIIIKITV